MTSPARVLLVEDDELFRETVRDSLVSAGYAVFEAADGAAAVGQAAARQHDLVLLDFDLSRMKGDEALERMLALRPGLMAYVLSGKDDLHQALWMGRRGAYAWIDKYVGTEKLLEIVAAGTQARPRGFDLSRLVAQYYPQPIAATYVRVERLAATASGGEQLAALRDLFEALAEYLAITGLSSYLNRGLIDEALNRQLIAVVERPSLAGWVNALRGLAAWLGDDPRFGWWHDVARLLDRRCEISQGADVARVLNSHVSGEAGAEPVNLLGWFALLADFHSLWLLPERFAEAESRELIAGLRPLLEQVVAALAVLADVELAVVQDVSVTAAGDYSVGLGTLSGQNFGQERTEAAAPPTRNELYLVARGTRELLLPVGPLMLCDCGEASSVVPHAVCTLLRWPDERRALYLSRASGHQRWIDDADVLARLRNLLLQLDPGGKRFSHLLRAVAVGLYDLSGYTTLTREHGPAVAREMVRRMVSAVREAAQVHGGYVGPVVGDEVLVYFDQPQPAVLAATDAMHTLLELNRRNPTAIHMHVGMDYGPGVVEKNDVWGDVINRAKRCQSLAGPGEIVISADMAGAIGDHDRFQLVAAQGNLKGFGEAEVFRVDYGGSQSS